MLKAPDFELSSTTRLILEMLVEKFQNGDDTVTMHELETRAGKGIDDIRGLFYTARRRFRHDYGRWWVNVPKMGYRLTPDEDLHKIAKSNRSRTRNLYRESLKVLKLGNTQKMSKEAATKTIMERSVAELGMATTAPSAIAKTEQIVARSHNTLTSEEQVLAIKEALTKK